MAPAALPLIMLAGAGLSAGGQIYGGQVAAAEGEAQQKLAEYNAQIAERQARSIEQKSLFEQRQQADEASRRQSSLVASMAGSGVVPTAGTGLAILGEQAGESELENRLIGYNYGLEAQQSRSRGQQFLYEGRLAKRRGHNQRTAAFIGAGSTLLSGFSGTEQKTGFFSKSFS